jgi:hypothetical protein
MLCPDAELCEFAVGDELEVEKAGEDDESYVFEASKL